MDESFGEELFSHAIDEDGVLGDVLLEPTKTFAAKPDVSKEPRDESGQWTKGGGSGKKGTEKPGKEASKPEVTSSSLPPALKDVPRPKDPDQAASFDVAASKITKVPPPTPEKKKAYQAKLAEFRKATAEATKNGTKPPQQRDYLDARGNSLDRKKRAKALFEEFGGTDKGYIVCPWTGIKMHYTDDPAENPNGYPKFEQGKIFTACQGGGYQPHNLIPESFTANRSRNDTRLRPENSEGC